MVKNQSRLARLPSLLSNRSIVARGSAMVAALVLAVFVALQAPQRSIGTANPEEVAVVESDRAQAELH